MTPPKTRNDYRTMSASALHEEAMRGTNVDYQELAIALAERVVWSRWS